MLKSQSTGRKRRKRKPSKSNSTGSLSSKTVVTKEEKTSLRDNSVKDERPSLTDVSNQQRTTVERETKMPSKKELIAVQNPKINHSEIIKSGVNNPVVSDVASHLDGDVLANVGGARVHGKSLKPANHPSNQPANHPANQPANHPADHPADHPANQPSNQPANHPANQPAKQPAKQPDKKVTNAPKKWTQLPRFVRSWFGCFVGY